MCIDYCRSALLMERSLRCWHPHMPERLDREEVADWITCPHGKAHLAGAPAPAAGIARRTVWCGIVALMCE